MGGNGAPLTRNFGLDP